MDARSDVYSAGVVLYEMLTGSRPFQGSTSSVMHKIVHAPAPRVSESTAAFPPALDAVVATVLAKDPSDRYQSAAAFASALTEYLHHSEVADEDEAQAAVEPAANSTIVRSGNWTRETAVTATVSTATAEPVVSSATPAVRRSRARVFAPLIGGACVVLAGLIWLSVHHPSGRSETQPATANLAEPRPNATPADNAVVPSPRGSGPATPVSPGAPTAPPPPATVPSASDTAGSKPAEPPRDTAPAVDHQSELLAGLYRVVLKIPCSLMNAGLDNGTTVTLNGLTALGEASELEIRGLIRQSIAQLAPTATVVWQVQRIKGPYCSVFDVLRPASDARARGPSVAPDQSGRGRFRVAMPDFAGSLTVDVYSGDGLVHHRFPASSAIARKLPANTIVPIEQPVVSHATDSAGAGPNVLTAVASSVPLFEAARPAQEPAPGYLKDLGDAIARVRASGATVAATRSASIRLLRTSRR